MPPGGATQQGFAASYRPETSRTLGSRGRGRCVLTPQRSVPLSRTVQAGALPVWAAKAPAAAALVAMRDWIICAMAPPRPNTCSRCNVRIALQDKHTGLAAARVEGDDHLCGSAIGRSERNKPRWFFVCGKSTIQPSCTSGQGPSVRLHMHWARRARWFAQCARFRAGLDHAQCGARAASRARTQRQEGTRCSGTRSPALLLSSLRHKHASFTAAERTAPPPHLHPRLVPSSALAGGHRSTPSASSVA